MAASPTTTTPACRKGVLLGNMHSVATVLERNFKGAWDPIFMRCLAAEIVKFIIPIQWDMVAEEDEDKP